MEQNLEVPTVPVPAVSTPVVSWYKKPWVIALIVIGSIVVITAIVLGVYFGVYFKIPLQAEFFMGDSEFASSEGKFNFTPKGYNLIKDGDKFKFIDGKYPIYWRENQHDNNLYNVISEYGSKWSIYIINKNSLSVSNPTIISFQVVELLSDINNVTYANNLFSSGEADGEEIKFYMAYENKTCPNGFSEKVVEGTKMCTK